MYSINNDKDWTKGSFYERLNDIINKFSICAMTRILQLLYTNNNINTILNNHHKDKSFEMQLIYVFTDLYTNYQLIENVPIYNNIDEIIDGQNKQSLQVPFNYEARFPFSNILSEYLNSKKSLIIHDQEDVNNDEDEDKDG